MDTTALVAFIGGGSLVATLLTQILKQAFHKASEKYGPIVAQMLLLGVSLCIAFLVFGAQFVPVQWLVASGAIFASAMVIYEVFYKTIYQTLAGKK